MLTEMFTEDGSYKTPTITISRREYDSLIEDRKLLNALKAAGVDKWDGYDFAIKFLENSDL